MERYFFWKLFGVGTKRMILVNQKNLCRPSEFFEKISAIAFFCRMVSLVQIFANRFDRMLFFSVVVRKTYI